jgi:SHS2 domain-containing protein
VGTFSFFDHAADVGIRVRAPSLESLFATAGRALMEWIGPAPAGNATVTESVAVRGDDAGELMVRWLQELLFLFQQRHLYFRDAEFLELTAESLSANIVGAAWDELSSADFQEVKAVTYHQLRVIHDGIGWMASIVLDV